jgi:hypothetical protein
MATYEQQPEPEGLGGSLKQLSEDLGLLVRKELELARNELAEKAKTAGIGAGMLSGSAISGLLTLGSLTACLILVLSLAIPAWLSALAVTVLWAIVTGVLAIAGKKKIQETGSLVPEKTLANVKEDVQWAQSGLKSGRS